MDVSMHGGGNEPDNMPGGGGIILFGLMIVRGGVKL
jgi:hypothetical protein